MTKSEYQAYKDRVAEFFETQGVNCLSADGEESFSFHICDCCGTLEGSRYDACGYSPSDDEVYEYVICGDCLYYAEYGQLNDMTMLDI